MQTGGVYSDSDRHCRSRQFAKSDFFVESLSSNTGMSKVQMTHAQRRERRRKIAEAVKAGKSITSLCTRYACSYVFIKNACKEFGVHIEGSEQRSTKASAAQGKSTKPAPSKMQIVARIVNTDEPFASIAREFGLTRARIQQVAEECREVGIRFPRRFRGLRVWGSTHRT